MEKYYTLLGADYNTSLKELKKKYINLMKKTHPDKGNDDKICKEINEAYQKILEHKLNGFCEEKNLPLVPKKFQEMGFEKIPTLHEYVSTLVKMQNTKKLEENEEILKIENIKKKSIFEKIFDFFFDEDSDQETEDI